MADIPKFMSAVGFDQRNNNVSEGSINRNEISSGINSETQDEFAPKIPY